jgi:hypothetical protein
MSDEFLDNGGFEDSFIGEYIKGGDNDRKVEWYNSNTFHHLPNEVKLKMLCLFYKRYKGYDNENDAIRDYILHGLEDEKNVIDKFKFIKSKIDAADVPIKKKQEEEKEIKEDIKDKDKNTIESLLFDD